MALDPITAGLELAKSAVSAIWPDKSAQEQAQLAAAVQLVQGQLEINKAEAASPNVFTSGWRPFIGWVCGVGCAWNWMGLPVLTFALAAAGHRVDMAPADLSQMWPLLGGMLGLGALRTVEKVKGVA
ncbi:MAG TPA: 3TM-type holin [Burkholderiaceae bacterium]|nr:3TM-type holin [Burkholderiaceae bacterium]